MHAKICIVSEIFQKGCLLPYLWACLLLGYSREISCFSSIAHTDFLIVPLLKTQYNFIRTSSTLNIVVETWLCSCLNSCLVLHFYSCVLLILCLPALIFSPFQDKKKDIFLLWPNMKLTQAQSLVKLIWWELSVEPQCQLYSEVLFKALISSIGQYCIRRCLNNAIN